MDEHQGYYGLLDEVRIWRTARTQSQIIQSMRSATGLEGHADLAAYWKFDDPQVPCNAMLFLWCAYAVPVLCLCRAYAYACALMCCACAVLSSQQTLRWPAMSQAARLQALKRGALACS